MIDAALLVPTPVPPPDHPDIPNPLPLRIGTLYRFRKAGVVLPRHSHSARSNHSTVVLAGSFSLSEGEATRTVRAGDILALAAEVPHEFRALEDESLILNLARLNATAESVREEFAQLTAQAQALQQAIGAARRGLDEFMAVVGG